MKAENTVEANGYTFTSYEDGTVVVTGELQSSIAAREGAMQAAAGGSARLDSDDGGHLVAARFNGPAIPENLSAQDRNLNRSSFKVTENSEANAIRDGAKISTERTAFVGNNVAPDGSYRPDAYMVNDHVTFASGNTQDVHLSLSNMSKAEQAEMNERTSAIFDTGEPNPGDRLRAQFTDNEYAQLMEETDQHLPSIHDEFAEWDVSVHHEMASEPNEANAMASDFAAETSALESNAAVASEDVGADTSSEADSSASSDSSASASDAAGADVGGDGGASPSDD